MELAQDTFEQWSGVRFANAADADTFFQNQTGRHYIKWFNATLAARAPWDAVAGLLDTPQNEVFFHQFWNRVPQVSGGSISVFQFVALMSIVSNEQRGNFFPAAEKMGRPGHKGMAYLFDRIDGLKRSYNTLDGNQTAFQCFRQPEFIEAHGAAALANTADARWSGEVWPGDVDTDPASAANLFLTQADFMKFRGRGLIQTTGRANYLPLIRFVQAYAGDNATLSFYKHRWSGLTADQAAFQSTNGDWDRLFQQTDMLVAMEAVRAHNVSSGNYFALAANLATLNGTGAGSVFNMGRRIGGKDAYGNLFANRVAAVLEAIPV